MHKIYSNSGRLLVVTYPSSAWEKGLNFVTNDKEYIQVGTWWYDEEKKLDRHYHNVASREADITQECVVVMTGAMLAHIYDEDCVFIEEVTLSAGDFALFLRGGHSYEILEDDTKIIEIKNGPYLGLDIDKTRF